MMRLNKSMTDFLLLISWFFVLCSIGFGLQSYLQNKAVRNLDKEGIDRAVLIAWLIAMTVSTFYLFIMLEYVLKGN